MSQTYAVIMAGGRGERLYPLSTPERPKQFLSLFGERTMLQQTVDRVLPLVPEERILVITSAEYVHLAREQLPGIPAANIIGEPLGKGTAPCIASAAFAIQNRDPEAVMVALPADHLISDSEMFRQLLRQAIAIAAQGTHLVTFGIDPSRPETGYGYIHAPSAWSGGTSTAQEPSIVLEVTCYTEKPDRETAERFMREETYYWNSGMFVWRVTTILEEIHAFMPELHQMMTGLEIMPGTAMFEKALAKIYSRLDSASIDRSVMEKSRRILLIPSGGIGWSDVGGWEALREALAIREKPWGHEHLWALNQHYAGKILHIHSGESLSLQFHVIKDETIHVLEGRLRLRIGSSEVELRELILSPGESCPIPPRTIHQMEALEDCVIAEVSTPHLTDVVRLSDRYGRAESVTEQCHHTDNGD
ncbi:mannose-1-phosphate guanylyltransferase [Candidatus Bipolaricaulota bacterium]